MLHHLLAPSLVRYAERDFDTFPAPADCTELGLVDYKFTQDGAYERHDGY